MSTSIKFSPELHVFDNTMCLFGDSGQSKNQMLEQILSQTDRIKDIKGIVIVPSWIWKGEI
jgi:hypothetical protein